MTPARLSVIGVGAVGRKHARLIDAHHDCSLVGICDVDVTRRSVAEELNVAFYRDVEELIEQQAPEGVVIATPTEQHAPVAEICSRRSIAVLIEKPIADTHERALRIAETADDTGSQVLVGHHRRHNPLVQQARSIVAGRSIGTLVGVSVLWALMKPSDYFEVDWRCRRPGGGPTLINLIHELDSLRFICGEIRRVYGHASSMVRGLDVEDSLSISLAFENGALGSILASDTTPSPWSYEATAHENPDYFSTDENCYYFLGTQASFAFPRMQIWRHVDKEHVGWQHPLEQIVRPVTSVDPLVAQLEHFCRVIRGKEQPIVDAHDAARSLAAAMAVLESIEHGVSVELQPS